MIIKRKTVWASIASCALLLSCGKDTNLNQIFKTSGEDERLDSLIAVGQVNFDQGNYDEAYEFAKKAYDRNPDNEEAAVLLAYTSLGQAGVDPFTLAKKLILKSSEKKTAEPTEGNSDDLLASSDAAGALSEFEEFISITEEDKALMIESNRETGVPSIFGDISVTIPLDPGAADGPRETVYTIKKIVEAIDIICPFVTHPTEGVEDSGALVEGYSLHDCEKSPTATKVPAKSNFLWSLAHLIEAIAYNTVLLSSSTSANLAETQQSALQQKAAKLKATKPDITNITQYVAAVQEIKEDVDAILKIDNGSMLYIILANLKAVSRGFNSIVGLPSNITKKIDEAIDSIETAAKKISDATGGGDANSLGTQSEALKNQLNKKVNSDVKSSIDSYNEKYAEGSTEYNKLDTEEKAKVEENKETLCKAYDGLISGITAAEKPNGC